MSDWLVEQERSSARAGPDTALRPRPAVGSEVAFGAWEANTRGIGSRLLAKMGYQPGQGLGKDGSGRVDPVPIVVLPPGGGGGMWRGC